MITMTDGRNSCCTIHTLPLPLPTFVPKWDTKPINVCTEFTNKLTHFSPSFSSPPVFTPNLNHGDHFFGFIYLPLLLLLFWLEAAWRRKQKLGAVLSCVSHRVLSRFYHGDRNNEYGGVNGDLFWPTIVEPSTWTSMKTWWNLQTIP